MQTVDYDQVARFEAASELLNVLMGMCISLKKTNEEYSDKLEEKFFLLSNEKQKLRTRDDSMVKKVRDIYGPIAREYYSNPKDFKLTKSFFEVRVILQEETPIRKAEYTYEELKAVHDNPHQPTADEIKNTFITDDEKVDISKLKIKKI